MGLGPTKRMRGTSERKLRRRRFVAWGDFAKNNARGESAKLHCAGVDELNMTAIARRRGNVPLARYCVRFSKRFRELAGKVLP